MRAREFSARGSIYSLARIGPYGAPHNLSSFPLLPSHHLQFYVCQLVPQLHTVTPAWLPQNICLRLNWFPSALKGNDTSLLPPAWPRASAEASSDPVTAALAQAHSTTIVVGGANDSTPAGPVAVARATAPEPAKKISFTRFTLAFNARHKTVQGPTSPTSPALLLPPIPLPPVPPILPSLLSPFPIIPFIIPSLNLKPIFKAAPKPAPLPAKSKRIAPSPLSRFVSLPPPRRSSYYDSESESDDESESEDEGESGFGHMMGPCLVGSFRPPPPKPRYHGHSRSTFGLTKWVWSTRLALCKGSGIRRLLRLRPQLPIHRIHPFLLSLRRPLSPLSPLPRRLRPLKRPRIRRRRRRPPPTPRSPTDALPYPLASHPSFLRLRRARPALLEEEDNRPSEPPVTIYPRMGDLRSLHEKGEWGVKVDRGFGGVGVWTLRKIVWICEVQEVQVRLKVQEAKGRELEEQRSSASASESETEDEETLVDSDSEWDSVSTTCSSRQDSGDTDAEGSEEGVGVVMGKGNLIEMAVGQVNSAGKEEEREDVVDVETSHMASSAWLCAFYRASAVVPSRAQRQGQMQMRGHVHSQMQWQGRWIVLLEIARRDGVRIKVVPKAPSSSVSAMREKVGRDVRWLKILGKSKADASAGAGKVVAKTVDVVPRVEVEGVCDHHRYS
ncbi:hypothetical protein DFP72DRAFT_1039546 [Ephemerocybe angulata]|uniref:Uncharacterized protein n=1 Tax=Ephemerocybe angulata TaxID=980116 RepID=A0A8H6IHL6_9AGAR|nr:hypothetical protein DFP72DRAFT_1039546 [Tulosesus angulatus]